MSDSRPKSILVVEDLPALRRLMCRSLRSSGYVTLAAGRASRAYEIVQARGGAIDLAILDMVLPGTSGLDLATWLDRDFPCISILYISGHIDSLAMECIAQRSPEHVLLKPFTQPQLLGRVEFLLSANARKDPGSEHVQPGTERSGTGTGD